MASYNLQTSQDPFKGGKNILASEHFQMIEVGATLDAAAFGAGTIELGTLIARNTTSGKYEPYPGTESTPGTFESGYDNPGILNIDVVSNGSDDVIVGEVLIRGSVYEAKLPTAVPDGFRAKNDNLRYVKEV